MLNIGKATSFSAHRSGWNYVMNHIMRFNSFNKIMLDDFVDITFGYNYKENIITNKIPYTKPWIGFIHHPPRICPWYDEEYKNQIDINNYIHSYEFQESMTKCEGIFVLSEYLKNKLQKNFDCFSGVPIFSIKHPTSFDGLLWDYNKFKMSGGRGTRVVSIGYFLRVLSTIYTAQFKNKQVERLLMPSSLQYAVDSIKNEIRYKKLKINKSLVKIIDWQDHNFYDKILEQSLVLLNLYDTSCNNAIIESIVRHCPMLINPHPAIKEYLGKNYPLYTKFDDLIDINNDRIYEAHEYLLNIDKTDLTIEHFCEKFEKNVNDITQKPRRKRTVKNLKSTKHKNVFCKTSNFNHRFGWPYVTKKIKQKLATTTVKPKCTNLYINDFTEHTFKNYHADNVKYISIDDKNYSGVRGKTLLDVNGSDFFIRNNDIYKWNDNLWENQKRTKDLNNSITLSKHETYINNNWIGIFHNPINMPKWFGYQQNINSIIQKSEFLEAFVNCKLVVVFSKSHKTQMLDILKKNNIRSPKIISLFHPIGTILENKQFNPEKYFANKKIMQIGYWQRNLHRFLCKNFLDHKKFLFFSDRYCAEILKLEHIVSPLKTNITTKTINNICDSIKNYNEPTTINDITILKTDKTTYDRYLSSGIIFSEYYDVSASNTIMEAIMYKTPIVTNRNAASEEYLGKNYPMFYDHPNQINQLLKENLIIDTHEYLKKINTEKMSIDVFLDKLKKEIDTI